MGATGPGPPSLTPVPLPTPPLRSAKAGAPPPCSGLLLGIPTELASTGEELEAAPERARLSAGTSALHVRRDP